MRPIADDNYFETLSRVHYEISERPSGARDPVLHRHGLKAKTFFQVAHEE